MKKKLLVSLLLISAQSFALDLTLKKPIPSTEARLTAVCRVDSLGKTYEVYDVEPLPFSGMKDIFANISNACVRITSDDGGVETVEAVNRFIWGGETYSFADGGTSTHITHLFAYSAFPVQFHMSHGTENVDSYCVDSGETLFPIFTPTRAEVCP